MKRRHGNTYKNKERKKIYEGSEMKVWRKHFMEELESEDSRRPDTKETKQR